MLSVFVINLTVSILVVFFGIIPCVRFCNRKSSSNMGGHGHGAPYTVPDPSIYKVENAPKLLKVQESLARQGLKDPWLRNEVWRYDAAQWGTHAQRIRVFMTRGLVWGIGLTAATVACEMAFAGDDHHGHGHGDDKGGHH